MENDDEITQLKSIIRNLDNRIKYLESIIDNIIYNNDTYNCYICSNYCSYDDEKCEYNIFCTNYICHKCISILKNDKDNKSICKNNKCNKWYCDDCINNINKYNDYIKCCIKCNIYQCNDHYDFNNDHYDFNNDHYETNNETKNDTCNNCNNLKKNEIIKDDDLVFI